MSTDEEPRGSTTITADFTGPWNPSMTRGRPDAARLLWLRNLLEEGHQEALAAGRVPLTEAPRAPGGSR